MSLRDTDEAHVALLAAGAISVGAGIVIVMLPAGLGLGLVAIVVGVAAILAAARSALTAWRRPRKAPARQTTGRRFWDARTRLESLMGVSAGMGGCALLVSAMAPEHERWSTALFSASVFVPAVIAWVIVRAMRRRRRK
ncbi:hypothetical protein [Microbacterium arborescens]|uniref:hypothetical protein n=1 Tax=Microbacterium arborescens TaxID=33883 RepID=UPI003C7848CF